MIGYQIDYTMVQGCGWGSSSTHRRRKRRVRKVGRSEIEYIYYFNNNIMKAINYLNLLGWGAVLFATLGRLIYLSNQSRNVNISPLHPIHLLDISHLVLLVKIVQTMQLFDILLVLIGKSKGSLLGYIAQIPGRLIVAIGFLSDDTEKVPFYIMAVMWSFADFNRYLYYVTKSGFTAFLRYNGFLILYPVGVYGQMCVINDYIRLNVEWLSIEQINYIRVIQAGIIIGMLFLYSYMLKMRKKYYRNSYFQGSGSSIKDKQE